MTVRFSLNNLGSYSTGKTTNSAQPNRIIMLNIRELIPNPNNTRSIKDDDVKTLAKSIEDVGGILNPILVQQDDNDKYVIYSGNLRQKAYLYLLDEKKSTVITNPLVPCIIHNFGDENPYNDVLSPEEAGRLALIIANRAQRPNLPPYQDLNEILELEQIDKKIYEKEKVKHIDEDFPYFTNWFAERLGIAKSEIYRRKSLLKIAEQIRPYIDDKTMELSLAYELAKLTEHDQMIVFEKLKANNSFTVPAMNKAIEELTEPEETSNDNTNELADDTLNNESVASQGDISEDTAEASKDEDIEADDDDSNVSEEMLESSTDNESSDEGSPADVSDESADDDSEAEKDIGNPAVDEVAEEIPEENSDEPAEGNSSAVEPENDDGENSDDVSATSADDADAENDEASDNNTAGQSDTIAADAVDDLELEPYFMEQLTSLANDLSSNSSQMIDIVKNKPLNSEKIGKIEEFNNTIFQLSMELQKHLLSRFADKA